MVSKSGAKRAKNGARYPSVSMTGYGKGTAETAAVTIDVELKTVNNRFLDINLKLPRLYADIESDVRERISGVLSRGRVEVHVSRRPKMGAQVAVQFNEPLFEQYVAVARKACTKRGTLDAASHSRLMLDLLNRPEVLGVGEETDLSRHETSAFNTALDEALKQLKEMRAAEGRRLATGITGHFSRLKSLARSIEKSSKRSPQELRQRLLTRLKTLGADTTIDPARLATEVTMWSDRLDVSEEILRLSSHLTAFHNALGEQPQGRKLDFIVQELGREFNTIGSKCQDAPTQEWVVQGKVELEKIREQIQNLE